MVGNLCFHCKGTGSVLGQEVKIPYAKQSGTKKKTIGAQVKGTLQVPDVPASRVSSFLTLDKLLTFICEQAWCRVVLRYDLWKVS